MNLINNSKELVNEFKDFITKGNVIDLAVAVIVGGAFTSIVSSLVKDVITPLIALALRPFGGQPDFSKYAIGAHQVVEAAHKTMENGKEVLVPGKTVLEGGIMYGNFLNALVSFVIVAAVIFFGIVKPMATLKALAKKKEDEAPPPPPPADIALLTEIRDLLKSKS